MDERISRTATLANVLTYEAEASRKCVEGALLVKKRRVEKALQQVGCAGFRQC
jgi:hypothetical protein